MHIDGVERAGRRLGRTSLRLRKRLRRQRRSMATIIKLCDSLVLMLRCRLEEEITDPDSSTIQDEFLTASSLLVDLEAELETVCQLTILTPHPI